MQQPESEINTTIDFKTVFEKSNQSLNIYLDNPSQPQKENNPQGRPSLIEQILANFPVEKRAIVKEKIVSDIKNKLEQSFSVLGSILDGNDPDLITSALNEFCNYGFLEQDLYNPVLTPEQAKKITDFTLQKLKFLEDIDNKETFKDLDGLNLRGVYNLAKLTSIAYESLKDEEKENLKSDVLSSVDGETLEAAKILIEDLNLSESESEEHAEATPKSMPDVLNDQDNVASPPAPNPDLEAGEDFIPIKQTEVSPKLKADETRQGFWKSPRELFWGLNLQKVSLITAGALVVAAACGYLGGVTGQSSSNNSEVTPLTNTPTSTQSNFILSTPTSVAFAPSATSTTNPSPTTTSTATQTATQPASSTPTASQTTQTVTSSATAVPSSTPTVQPSNTVPPSLTSTQAETIEPSATNTTEPTATEISTETPVPTIGATQAETATDTPTLEAMSTIPPSTSTSTPNPTSTLPSKEDSEETALLIAANVSTVESGGQAFEVVNPTDIKVIPFSSESQAQFEMLEDIPIGQLRYVRSFKEHEIFIQNGEGKYEATDYTPTFGLGEIYWIKKVDDDYLEILPENFYNQEVSDGIYGDLPYRTTIDASRLFVKVDEEAFRVVNNFEPISITDPSAVKTIYVLDDKSTGPRLILFEGETPVAVVPVILGKESSPTVYGEHTIFRNRLFSHMGVDSHYGGVPFPNFFNGGQAIHGAYWRDFFQHSNGGYGSNGCVNVPSANWYDLRVGNEFIPFDQFIYRWISSNKYLNIDESNENQQTNILEFDSEGYNNSIHVNVVGSINELPVELVENVNEALEGNRFLLPSSDGKVYKLEKEEGSQNELTVYDTDMAFSSSMINVSESALNSLEEFKNQVVSSIEKLSSDSFVHVEGPSYEFGGKDISTYIDCSGLVYMLTGAAQENINMFGTYSWISAANNSRGDVVEVLGITYTKVVVPSISYSDLETYPIGTVILFPTGGASTPHMSYIIAESNNKPVMIESTYDYFPTGIYLSTGSELVNRVNEKFQSVGSNAEGVIILKPTNDIESVQIGFRTEIAEASPKTLISETQSSNTISKSEFETQRQSLVPVKTKFDLGKTDDQMRSRLAHNLEIEPESIDIDNLPDGFVINSDTGDIFTLEGSDAQKYVDRIGAENDQKTLNRLNNPNDLDYVSKQFLERRIKENKDSVQFINNIDDLKAFLTQDEVGYVLKELGLEGYEENLPAGLRVVSIAGVISYLVIEEGSNAFLLSNKVSGELKKFNYGTLSIQPMRFTSVINLATLRRMIDRFKDFSDDELLDRISKDTGLQVGTEAGISQYRIYFDKKFGIFRRLIPKVRSS